jgi:hypothetical protein
VTASRPSSSPTGPEWPQARAEPAADKKCVGTEPPSGPDDLLHAALDQLGLPREYAAAARGHPDALDVLRTSNRLWTHFSPAEGIALRLTCGDS